MIEKTKTSWIDISVPLRDSMMHWPSDPPVSIKRVKDMEPFVYFSAAELKTFLRRLYAEFEEDA